MKIQKRIRKIGRAGARRVRTLLIQEGYRWMPERSWRSWAQPGELRWHLHDSWRASDSFLRDNARLFRHLGFEPGQFAGKTVIDLGAGSRLRTRFFEGARIVAIEPLADEFRRQIEWCDLSDAWRCVSSPAESFQQDLARQADFVISINVLDHCYQFDAILRNVFGYLKPGAGALLSFDSHGVTDALHPLVLTEPAVRERMERSGLDVVRTTRGLGPLGTSYGHGEALNFWLHRV